jgi:predicted HTH transcriptional regulator
MNINELIGRDEGKTLEFKRDVSSPRNILKTLTAFANTAGGVLLIGIEDGTKDVLGLKNPLDEEERLCSLIADSIEPRLVPNVELISWQDRTLIAVEVYPSGSRPHWLKSEGPMEGVHVRLGSTNRQADIDLIQELRRSALGAAFDEQPLPETEIDELDFRGAVTCFSRYRKLTKKDLETLRLVTKHQGRMVPTVGGILLFAKHREAVFPDAWIQCGRFIGKTKSHIFDHTEIYDHLPIVVERVMDFLKKHAMRGADFSELHRRDVWSIPLVILREAIVNAVVHTDYSQKGAPIRVSFFDDRIEIENPGILLPGLTFDDIRQGVSKLRNRVIARVFRELDLIEQWGSGIRRIFEEAEQLGLPEPQMVEIGMRVRFIVYLAQPFTPVNSNSQPSTQTKPAEQVTDQVAEQVTEQVTEQATEQVKRLFICLQHQPLSIRKIMQYLELRHRPTLLYDYLKPAMDGGFVEMTQPDSPKSPTQKYRLTKKGERLSNETYLAQPVISNSQPSMQTEPTEQVVEQVTEQVVEQVTEQVKRLFICLRHQPLSIRKIMQSLELRHRPTLLYDYLKPAMDGGFVEMTQPDSPKSPTQKYRLTKKGERLSNET